MRKYVLFWTLGVYVAAGIATAAQAAQLQTLFVTYKAVPPTMKEMADTTTVIIRARVEGQLAVKHPALSSATKSRVRILEVLKNDGTLQNGTVINVYEMGSREVDPRFVDDFKAGEELVIFLERRPSVEDGYVIAYGPDGTFMLQNGYVAPHGKSALAKGQSKKVSDDFVREVKREAAKK